MAGAAGGQSSGAGPPPTPLSPSLLASPRPCLSWVPGTHTTVIWKSWVPRQQPTGHPTLCFSLGQGPLEEQVIQANPVLEAFRNAKTTRSNTSSSFVSVMLAGDPRVVGKALSPRPKGGNQG